MPAVWENDRDMHNHGSCLGKVNRLLRTDVKEGALQQSATHALMKGCTVSVDDRHDPFRPVMWAGSASRPQVIAAADRAKLGEPTPPAPHTLPDAGPISIQGLPKQPTSPDTLKSKARMQSLSRRPGLTRCPASPPGYLRPLFHVWETRDRDWTAYKCPLKLCKLSAFCPG